MNVTDAIGDWARRAPGGAALVAGTRVFDRAGLDAAVGAAMAGLAAAGLAQGDVVAVVPSADPALHVAVVLALARMGAVQLPLRPGEPDAAHAALARLFAAVAVVAAQPVPALDLPRVHPAADWLAGRAPTPPTADVPDAPWIIAFSSGTTGSPKGIAVTHAMEIARNARDRQCFAHGPGEPYLTLIGPGFYNSTSAIVRCLAQGGTAILPQGLRTQDELLETVERNHVGFLQLTPSHLFKLVEALPDGRLRLPGLRVLRVSSAALPARILELTRRRLTPAVHLTYGTNEAGTLAVATPTLLARHPATAGRPLAGVEMELVGPDGRPVDAGQAGVVRVRGPGVMDAYRGDDAATRLHCRDGWFHPGDFAMRDREGLLFLKGRSDRLMNIGGVLTAAEEIEAVMLAHPAVAEAAVVPVSSERFQVIPAVVVVLREPVGMQVLADHARQTLRGYPIRLFQTPALPRNAIGKVDYPRVARVIEARRQADGDR